MSSDNFSVGQLERDKGGWPGTHITKKQRLRGVCARVRVHLCTCVSACARVFVCMQAHVRVFVHVCVRAHVQKCVCTCKCVCVSTCVVCVCGMHACIYV